MILPQVGQTWVHKKHSDREYVIVGVDTRANIPDDIRNIDVRTDSGTEFTTDVKAVYQHLTLKVEGFKLPDLTGTYYKPQCPHKNIKRDRFFSAKIYETCTDCGVNLN